MEWLSYLLILLCPLMMVFMMKGHGGGHHKHNNSYVDHDLENKIIYLNEENKKLHNEIENLSALVKKNQ